MTISVLIVSYNVAPRLRRCLEALTAAAADLEIIVVDNASPDDSAAMVARDFPGVRLLAWEENHGFSAAINAAARLARGHLLLLLNPDARVDAGALARMPEALASRPGVAAVGFRQLDDNGRFQLSVGPPPSLALEIVRRFVQRRLDAGDERLGHMLDRLLARPRPVPWAAASSLLVRRSAFEAVGGFDERFFLYFEDIDFCLRLRAAGFGVYYDPSIVVSHERGESARSAPEVARRAYRESQLYYWSKHRGTAVRTLVRLYQLLWRPA